MQSIWSTTNITFSGIVGFDLIKTSEDSPCGSNEEQSQWGDFQKCVHAQKTLLLSKLGVEKRKIKTELLSC